MLLHKTKQSTTHGFHGEPKPQPFLASRSAYGQLNGTLYVKGGNGGFLKVGKHLSGALKRMEKRAKMVRRIRQGISLLVVAGLVALAWVLR